MIRRQVPSNIRAFLPDAVKRAPAYVFVYSTGQVSDAMDHSDGIRCLGLIPKIDTDISLEYMEGIIMFAASHVPLGFYDDEKGLNNEK